MIEGTDVNRRDWLKYDREAAGLYMPGVSVNIVVFNYRNGILRVLVMRFGDSDQYMLPGGYVMNHEDLDDAAMRIFNEWTGLRNIPLEQFYTSGKADRVSEHMISDILRKNGGFEAEPWLEQRKISVCYFSLLHEQEINPSKLDFVSGYHWMDLSEVPHLLFDHNHIISKGIHKVQENLEHILSENLVFKNEFTMGELQKFYEAVFQRSFTRTNFQRRMLNLGILKRIGKHYTGKAHKAPYLYSFKNSGK